MTAQDLVGKKIAGVRPLSEDEKEAMDWHSAWSPAMVLELDDGTRLFPSGDSEGNQR